MTRRRDLSGFGGGTAPPAPAPPRPSETRAAPRTEEPLVPPPPSVAAEPEPPVTPRRKPSGSRPVSRVAKKRRITLSLPTTVAVMLRSAADRERRVYLDIILEAFVEHAPAIDQSFVQRRRASQVRSAGGRRRADAGRTQIPLNILEEDLKELDRKARALSLDRSAYVTELLVRSLG